MTRIFDPDHDAIARVGINGYTAWGLPELTINANTNLRLTPWANICRRYRG